MRQTMPYMERVQAGHRDILLDIPMCLLGSTPSPGLSAPRPVEHA